MIINCLPKTNCYLFFFSGRRNNRNFVLLIQINSIMRNKTFLLTLFVACSVFCLNSYAKVGILEKEGEQIVLNSKPVNPPERPRMPANNPFYAELTDFGVLLAADSDWGNATVTLSSLEGDYYQTTFDMADGSILLPVNGNAGNSYIITIVLSGGLAFEGEFCL